MKRTVGIVSWLVLVALAPAGATTLDDYLARLEQTHPLFARERLQTGVAALELERLRGREDWQLVASPTYTHRDPLRVSPFDPERVDALRLGAGAERVFWQNGSRLGVGWSYDVLDQDLPGFAIPVPGGVIEVPVGPSTYYTHVLRATYSLPLLRNRGGLLDRLDYRLAEYDVDLSAVAAAENEEAFLLDAAKVYLDWVLTDELLRIGRERLELAREELDRTRRKRSSYLVDEADVLRAQDAVHLAQGAVLLAQSRWKSLRAELATLAGWSDDEQGEPAFDLYDRGERPLASDVGGDVAQTRALRSIDLEGERLAAMEEGAGAAVQPELALNLSGALLGGDSELDGSLEMTHPDLTVGLEFRYPLGNHGAVAALDAARLRRRQLELKRREVEVDLSSTMRSIVVALDELSGVLDLDRERIDTARRKTEEELSLYNQGRGDLTFVIQSRDNEAGAKLAYAENALYYHKLLLQYRALADRLRRGEGDF